MKQQSYYSVLGLRKGASLQEIKRRFRQLALRFHPDRNPEDPLCEEKFKRVAEAYHVLSDRQRRQIYDDKGYQGLKRGGYRGFRDIEDVLMTLASEFLKFLGVPGGPSRLEPLRGADLCYELEISVEEAAVGVRKTVEIVRMETCLQCQGIGARTTFTLEVCPWCGGSGEYSAVSAIFSSTGICRKCNGKGNLRQLLCSSCDGRGRRQAKVVLELDLPTGVEDRTRIKFPRKGDDGERGASSGDLFLLVHVRSLP